MLLLTIVGSVTLVLAVLSALLLLFVRNVLKNDATRLARLLVGLLILQFVLGMLSNLFVKIPMVEPWRVFHELGPILLHTINATLLLILSVIFAAHAIKSHTYATLALVASVAVAVAYASGVTFVNAGQNDIFSFTMSIGFITALTIYAFLAFRSPASKRN